MPALSRIAKIYKSLLKQTGKTELPYIREQLRVISPEATKQLSSVHVRPTLTNIGEVRNVMGLDEMSLHPAALARATDAPWLKRDFPTLGHEFGHTTMAGVDVEEMRKLQSGTKMKQYLEDRADEFAMVVAARAGIPTRGTMKMTPEKRQKIFKYLLGAGAGGAVMANEFDEDEALAMRGVFNKAGEKIVKGAVSSTLERLKGTTVQGRVIQDIRKGAGPWRTVFFEDGTSMTLKASDLNTLVRGQMTHKYLQKFEERDVEGRTQQAKKSLQFHESRGKMFESREMIRRYHTSYLKDLKEMGEELPPNTCFVIRGNRYFVMPRPYAEHLQELGVLKIMEGPLEREVLK